MNPPSVDVRDMLVEADIGLVFATNLFVGEEPATPDDCVTIFDTPGRGRQLTMQRGEEYHYSAIQIRVRNRTYLSGYSQMLDIVDTLHGVGPVEYNSTTYTVITCTQEPFYLGRDENGRFWWVCNFDIQRVP